MHPSQSLSLKNPLTLSKEKDKTLRLPSLTDKNSLSTHPLRGFLTELHWDLSLSLTKLLTENHTIKTLLTKTLTWFTPTDISPSDSLHSLISFTLKNKEKESTSSSSLPTPPVKTQPTTIHPPFSNQKTLRCSPSKPYRHYAATTTNTITKTLNRTNNLTPSFTIHSFSLNSHTEKRRKK